MAVRIFAQEVLCHLFFVRTTLTNQSTHYNSNPAYIILKRYDFQSFLFHFDFQSWEQKQTALRCC